MDASVLERLWVFPDAKLPHLQGEPVDAGPRNDEAHLISVQLERTLKLPLAVGRAGIRVETEREPADADK